MDQAPGATPQLTIVHDACSSVYCVAPWYAAVPLGGGCVRWDTTTIGHAPRATP